MKKVIKKVIKLAPLAFLFLPSIALAANAVNQGLRMQGLSVLFGGGLAGERTLPDLIFAVIELLLLFAGAIAVLFIIIGGYYYITAQGNEEQAEKGKNTLVNAVIGIVVVILAYAIVTVVQNTISGP